MPPSPRCNVTVNTIYLRDKEKVKRPRLICDVLCLHVNRYQMAPGGGLANTLHSRTAVDREGVCLFLEAQSLSLLCCCGENQDGKNVCLGSKLLAGEDRGWERTILAVQLPKVQSSMKFSFYSLQYLHDE